MEIKMLSRGEGGVFPSFNIARMALRSFLKILISFLLENGTVVAVYKTLLRQVLDIILMGIDFTPSNTHAGTNQLSVRLSAYLEVRGDSRVMPLSMCFNKAVVSGRAMGLSCFWCYIRYLDSLEAVS